MLEPCLEHGRVHLVEGDEGPHGVVPVVLGRLVGDLQDGPFVALDLGVDVLQLHERVEHVHDELELIRHERVVVDEVLPVGVLAEAGREVELGVQGILLLVEEFPELHDSVLVLVEDTLLGDVLGVGALEGDTGLEAAEDLPVLVGSVVDVATVKHLRQVLLCGAADPDLLGTVLGQRGDDLLQLEEQLLAGADELADLVDEEQQAVVVSLPGNIRLQFKAELLRGGVDCVLGDLVPDDVDGQGRDLRRLLEDVVEFGDGEGLSLRLPVEAVLREGGLELVELSLVLEGLLEVLGEGDAELVEPAEGVELLPDGLREGRVVGRAVADLVADVEEHRVDLRLPEPLHQILEVGDGGVESAVRMRQRVEVVHGLKHPLQCLVAMGGGEAEIEILQEVGLTGAVVSVDPDAGVADVPRPDGVQDAVQTVQDFVREDVFLDLDLDGGRAVIRDGDGGIEGTSDVVLV